MAARWSPSPLFTLVLTAINVRGVTRGAWVGNLLTIAKMLPLSLIALAGLWFAGWDNIPTTAPQEPNGLTDGLLLALFACFGFEVAAIVAGEMREPRRDLAISILAGLGISCALYLLLMLACYAVLPDTAASSAAARGRRESTSSARRAAQSWRVRPSCPAPAASRSRFWSRRATCSRWARAATCRPPSLPCIRG